MSGIVWLKECQKLSHSIIGRKAARLAELKQHSFPVPEAFVITPNVYAKFLQDTQLHDKLSSLDLSLKQEMIVSTRMPEDLAEEITDNYELLSADPRKASELVETFGCRVAVRSSSSKGATYLNIKGADNLMAAIIACWASSFDSVPAIIVQQMVDADISGTMSTDHAEDTIAIKGISGVGGNREALPTTYLVSKKSREVVKWESGRQHFKMFCSPDGSIENEEIPKHRREAQNINDAQLKELTRVGTKVEQQYGYPQQLRWVMAKDQVYFL